MNHMKSVVFLCSCLLLILSLAGCGSMFPIKAYTIQTAKPPATQQAATHLSLSNRGQPVDEPYTVLGKVMAYKRGGLGATRELDYVSTPPADMVQALKGPALAMGADGVIGIYHGEYRGMNSAGEYVSGLAVTHSDMGAATSMGHADLQVGILPVQTGKSTIDADDYADIDRDFRVGARWLLENKGYYAPVDTRVKFKGSVADLQAMSRNELDRLYGADTELLLVLELLDEQAVVPVLVEQRTVKLKATLFSKSLKQVIWENTVEKEQVTGVFWIWMATSMARATAIESVLEPMPFFMRADNKEFTRYQPDMIKKMAPEK